eukprot:scaffold32312_cov24-Tisochrysis_lutea.AAC.2
MLSPGAGGGMNAFSPLVAQGGILGGQVPPPSPGSVAEVAAAVAATTHSLRSPMHRAEQNLPPSPPAINQQASSPQPSASGASQLFDTLVMAATGEAAVAASLCVCVCVRVCVCVGNERKNTGGWHRLQGEQPAAHMASGQTGCLTHLLWLTCVRQKRCGGEDQKGLKLQRCASLQQQQS